MSLSASVVGAIMFFFSFLSYITLLGLFSFFFANGRKLMSLCPPYHWLIRYIINCAFFSLLFLGIRSHRQLLQYLFSFVDLVSVCLCVIVFLFGSALFGFQIGKYAVTRLSRIFFIFISFLLHVILCSSHRLACSNQHLCVFFSFSLFRLFLLVCAQFTYKMLCIVPFNINIIRFTCSSFSRVQFMSLHTESHAPQYNSMRLYFHIKCAVCILSQKLESAFFGCCVCALVPSIYVYLCAGVADTQNHDWNSSTEKQKKT